MTRGGFRSWGNLLVEFVLVVVGVLVALGVDGWATDRADRVTEGYYLDQLRQDIAESEQALRVNFVQRLTAARDAGIQVLPYLRRGRAVGLGPQQLVVRIFHAGRAYGDYSQAYADEVYQTLRSTGDLKILQDRQLRDHIISFYARGEQNGFLLAGLPGEYNRLVREKLPWDVQREIRNRCPILTNTTGCTVDLSTIDATEFLALMGNNQQVADALNLLLTRLDVTIRVLDESRSQAQELLFEIDSTRAH